MNDKIKISKTFTAGDWKKMRTELLLSNDKWENAVHIFDDRILSRFFNPIEKIKFEGKNEGEGFSIALISVVLLEFLAAFEFGKIYKTNKDGLAPHQYYSGIRLLKSFLSNSNIFKIHFDSNSKIQLFYENIRCGLVLEARTMQNDVIISDSSFKNTSSSLIYFLCDDERRLNRDLLLQKIKEHILEYKIRIERNDSLVRNKFILKMDDISGLKHVWYFIYGSNLYEEQLVKRLNDINEVYLQKQRCSLNNYHFIYNKKSKDGSSKGNLIKMENCIVQGIAILILENKLDKFIEEWEHGYLKEEVYIQTEENYNKKDRLTFKAYTCISNKTASSPPSKEYVSMIIKGANENNLPIDYIENKLKYMH
jgi:hypothetical protein